MTQRPSRLVQLLAVIRKETLQTVHDRRVMFMLVVAPVMQLIVFGFAVDFEVDRVPTVVVDQDSSAASREHARRLLADGTLRRVGTASSAAEADQALDRGEAAAAVVLPRGLGRRLDRGDPAEVQVIIDGTDPNRATAAAAAVSGYFANAGIELVRSRAGIELPAQISASRRVWYNPGLDSPPFMIPGVMAMLLVVVTTIVTAMGLAREREVGTLEQVLVTPIGPTTLLLGKLLPFVVIGIIDVSLALTVGTWVFDLPMRGPLAVLALAALLYLLSTIGIGLFISTVSRTQQQAFLGGFLFTMPAMLLSGVMTPIRSMPEWLQAVTYLNPLRYVVEVLRANLLKGAGFLDVWPNLLALAVFGTGIVLWASMRFHKRMA